MIYVFHHFLQQGGVCAYQVSHFYPIICCGLWQVVKGLLNNHGGVRPVSDLTGYLVAVPDVHMGLHEVLL